MADMLDLSKLSDAPQKVKLLDGNLYDMADPEELGALALQRIVSRKRAADELMAKTDATEEDIETMLSLLVDICEVIVPAASREELGRLHPLKMEQLVRVFSGASPLVGEAEGTSDG